jgi:hypothetical protein
MRKRENEEGLVTEWNKIGGKKKSKIEENALTKKKETKE